MSTLKIEIQPAVHQRDYCREAMDSLAEMLDGGKTCGVPHPEALMLCSRAWVAAERELLKIGRPVDTWIHIGYICRIFPALDARSFSR